MKFEINLDELVEIRAKLGNPRFTGGRDEYGIILPQQVHPFEGLGRPIRGGMVEVIFKFDYESGSNPVADRDSGKC